MSKSITVSIEVQKEGLPVLEDSNFVYTQKVVGLIPPERQIFSNISVKKAGLLVTDINAEERQALIRLFRSLADSLENYEM